MYFKGKIGRILEPEDSKTQSHTRRKFRSNRQYDISFGVSFRSKLRVENWPAVMLGNVVTTT